MYPFKASWENWTLLNGVVFFGFFVALFFSETLVGLVARVIFGIILFFLTGINLSLVENIILRVKDWFFILTLGLFNALFIVPVFVLITFSFLHDVTEFRVIMFEVMLVGGLLGIQYKYRHEIITP